MGGEEPCTMYRCECVFFFLQGFSVFTARPTYLRSERCPHNTAQMTTPLLICARILREYASVVYAWITRDCLIVHYDLNSESVHMVCRAVFTILNPRPYSLVKAYLGTGHIQRQYLVVYFQLYCAKPIFHTMKLNLTYFLRRKIICIQIIYYSTEYIIQNYKFNNRVTSLEIAIKLHSLVVLSIEVDLMSTLNCRRKNI